jgi:hypothetical protein
VVPNSQESLRGEESTPFSKGPEGIKKGLIIPLNPPLKKGDLKTSVPDLWIVKHIYLQPEKGFEMGSKRGFKLFPGPVEISIHLP